MSKYTLAQISYVNKNISPEIICREMLVAGLLKKENEAAIKNKLKEMERLSGGKINILELFDDFSRNEPELANALEIVVHKFVSRNFS